MLRKFIPEMVLAKDKDAYQLALLEMVTTLNDTHANVWSGARGASADGRVLGTRYRAVGGERASGVASEHA